MFRQLGGPDSLPRLAHADSVLHLPHGWLRRPYSQRLRCGDIVRPPALPRDLRRDDHEYFNAGAFSGNGKSLSIVLGTVATPIRPLVISAILAAP